MLQLVQAERMATQALKDGYQKFDLELSRMQQMLLMALERCVRRQPPPPLWVALQFNCVGVGSILLCV